MGVEIVEGEGAVLEVNVEHPIVTIEPIRTLWRRPSHSLP